MHQRLEVIIPFKDGSEKESKWVLIIRRDNNSSALELGLHWGDKPYPAHLAVEDVEDFKKALAPLLAPQVST